MKHTVDLTRNIFKESITNSIYIAKNIFELHENFPQKHNIQNNL